MQPHGCPTEQSSGRGRMAQPSARRVRQRVPSPNSVSAIQDELTELRCSLPEPSTPSPSTPPRKKPCGHQPVRSSPLRPQSVAVLAEETWGRRLRACSDGTVAEALFAVGLATEGTPSDRVRRLALIFRLGEPASLLERWPTSTLRAVAGEVSEASADRQGVVAALLERFFPQNSSPPRQG